MVFNVTEGIAGAVNNCIGFAGDTERKVVILRILTKRSATGEQDQAESNKGFKERVRFVFYHSVVSSSAFETRIYGKKERPRLNALTRLGKAHNRTKSRAVKTRHSLCMRLFQNLPISLERIVFIKTVSRDGYVFFMLLLFL